MSSLSHAELASEAICLHGVPVCEGLEQAMWDDPVNDVGCLLGYYQERVWHKGTATHAIAMPFYLLSMQSLGFRTPRFSILMDLAIDRQPDVNVHGSISYEAALEVATRSLHYVISVAQEKRIQAV